MVAAFFKAIGNYFTADLIERILWWAVDKLVDSSKPEWDDELRDIIKGKVEDKK